MAQFGAAQVGCALEPGQGRRGVVQYEDEQIRPLVGHVEQRVRTQVEEVGIPDDGDHRVAHPGQDEARCDADARTHGILHVEHLEGRRVDLDRATGIDHVHRRQAVLRAQIAQDFENRCIGAVRRQSGLAGQVLLFVFRREVAVRLVTGDETGQGFRDLPAEQLPFPRHGPVVLAADRRRYLRVIGNRLDQRFQKGFVLFQYQGFLRRTQKAVDLIGGQRPQGGQLEDGQTGGVRPMKHVHQLGVNYARGDYAGLSRAGHGVEVRPFEMPRDRFEPVVQPPVQSDGVSGNRYPAHGMPFEGVGPHVSRTRNLRLFQFLFQRAEGFRDAHDERHLRFTGKPERLPRHSDPLGGRRRFQHGQFASPGDRTGVLVVLGGPCARIVPEQDDQPRAHVRQVRHHDGIERDVEPDALAPHQGRHPADGRADRRFEGDLFVGGPFNVQTVTVHEAAQELDGAAARRTWIARRHRDTRLQCAVGDGLVTGDSHPGHETLPLRVKQPVNERVNIDFHPVPVKR